MIYFCYFFICVKDAIVSIELADQWVRERRWEWGLAANRYEGTLGGIGDVPNLDCGDGCLALQIY